jgi:hypothetical protein
VAGAESVTSEPAFRVRDFPGFLSYFAPIALFLILRFPITMHAVQTLDTAELIKSSQRR